jgi:hypothetical protein
MKNKWVSSICPFAKDQGFSSVIGDVAPGETVFGFTHIQVAAQDDIYFRIATSGKVNQMSNTNYKVEVTKVSADSEVSVPFGYNQYKDHFTLDAEAGEQYDVVVIGKMIY